MVESTVNLVALAESANTRSVRGVVILILDDIIEGLHKYARKRNVKETYSPENKAIIDKCFVKYGVRNMKVICYNSKADIPETIATALEKLDMVKFNYLACPTVSSEDDKKLISDFIKAQRKADNILTHAVLHNYAVADDEGIISFLNDNVYLGDGTTLSGDQYCVDVACMCATNAINKSLTNKIADGVKSVDEIEDKDKAIDEGNIFLYYDNDLESVIFSRAVNSKTTIKETEKEELKKIRLVEILDMIRDDMKLEWKANYQGKVENTYDERLNLCTKYNTYLNALMRKKFLNNYVNYTSYCEINLEKTKNYLEDLGIDVSEMTDSEILTHDMKEHVFLKAHAYPVDVMEDMDLEINY
ncbi:MAG: phage tail sheath protein [Clostridium butyricum]|nr:phage tail sheath protein [Clostridium butyricum]